MNGSAWPLFRGSGKFAINVGCLVGGLKTVVLGVHRIRKMYMLVFFEGRRSSKIYRPYSAGIC